MYPLEESIVNVDCDHDDYKLKHFFASLYQQIETSITQKLCLEAV